ncbi:MAG: glycosyl transferase [Deltaproteobacteria bacterium CG2_30_66_27]|nr:MAG: glycosyl transferase [Deltaproteobacteria bacterium CG2_30_66_27]PJB32404.1 MAG: glycosyl transferase [Deltaproteobacteria bacterium CG_4_9_14_3_um_filter_65_9]
MRFLLVPGNNSLSHVAKCLALESSLTSRGHRVVVAVSRKRAGFVEGRGVDTRILPDIQESDEAGFPTVAWFHRPKRIAECISSEVDLMKEIRPDRVLGVFRFTLKASARLAGIPFDSLSCGCMLPRYTEVLGFAPGEAGSELQRYYLDSFYRYAGAKTSLALRSFGLPAIGDIRSMLEGDRTFLWDFPEFAPLPDGATATHVGPISWNGWHDEGPDPGGVPVGRRPLAVVTFGTCMMSAEAASRILRILLDLGYEVVLAAGGQNELMNVMADEPRVTIRRFAPLRSLFSHASITVCHGGQLTVFEALSHRIPVLIMPFQPEQAHNAVCLKRLGCGDRLVPALPFRGNPEVYLEAFRRTEDREIQSVIRGLIEDPGTAGRLSAIRDVLGKYDGTATLTSLIETG